MKNIPFVVASICSWDHSLASNIRALAGEISRSHDVLYINPPLDMISLLGNGSRDIAHKSGVLVGNRRAIEKMNHRLWVLEPPIVVQPLHQIYSPLIFDAIIRKNNKRFADAISWALQELDINEFNLIVASDLFGSFYLKEFLNPQMLIYYRSHDFKRTDHYKYHASRLEPDMISKSDLNITTSDALAVELRQHNYNTFNIGQGVNLKYYNKGHSFHVPVDMSEIPHPIIGTTLYADASEEIVNLISDIGKKYQRCSLVVMGMDEHSYREWLVELPDNVFLMGNRQEKDMADYINCFDVCVNLESLNNFDNRNTHNRIAQYLSLGKQVITSLPDTMRLFAKHVIPASNPWDVVDKIGDALLYPFDDCSVIRNELFANSLTWDRCVQRFLSSVDMVERGKSMLREHEQNSRTMAGVYN